MPEETPTPTPTPTPAPAVDMDAFNKMKAQLAGFEAKEAQRTAEVEQNTLKTEFPQVTDWTVIPGSNLAERRANAAKIVAMFPKVEKPAAKAEAGPTITNPGDAFANAGAHGGGTGEEGDQGRTIALKAELDAAVKKGAARAALEACIKLQPKAVANLYGMTR